MCVCVNTVLICVDTDGYGISPLTLGGGVRVLHFVEGMQIPLQNDSVQPNFLYKMHPTKCTYYMYFVWPQPCILYKMQPRLCTNKDFEPTAADPCLSFCRETTLGSLSNISIRLALSICRHLLPFSQQKITSMMR